MRVVSDPFQYEEAKQERLRLYKIQMEKEAKRRYKEMMAEQAASERQRRNRERNQQANLKYRSEARQQKVKRRMLTPEERSYQLLMRTVSKRIANLNPKVQASTRRRRSQPKRNSVRLQTLAQAPARRSVPPPQVQRPLISSRGWRPAVIL